jgi:hypothetical protein
VAVRGYDGEVGGDAGAGGGVVAGYGEKGFDGLLFVWVSDGAATSPTPLILKYLSVRSSDGIARMGSV